jgi:hypothetical protein
MTAMAVAMSLVSQRYSIDGRVLSSSPLASPGELPLHEPPRGVFRWLRTWLGDAVARSRDRQRLLRLGFDARQDLGRHRVEAELRKRAWEK